MVAWRIRGVGLPDGEDLDAGVDSAGRWTSTPPVDADLLPGRFVLSGLVDAHCHLSLAWGPDDRPVALDTQAMRANLASAYAAGVTGIRDTGSPGSVSLQLLDTAEGVGLVACGRFLAPPDRFFPGLHDPVPAGSLVDAALAEVRAGARWVKIIGDFPTLPPARRARPHPRRSTRGGDHGGPRVPRLPRPSGRTAGRRRHLHPRPTRRPSPTGLPRRGPSPRHPPALTARR